VRRNLDARDWTNADLARAIRHQFGHGPDESVIGRWRTRGARPNRESVEKVAAVFGVDIRKALVAAGYVRAHEIDAEWADPGAVDLSEIPDEALIEEVQTRLIGKHRRHPINNEHGRMTVSPSSAGAHSTTVVVHPAHAETAPPPPDAGGERAGTADCMGASGGLSG
jgi:hypothetical protein